MTSRFYIFALFMICIGLSKQSFTLNTVPKDRGQTIFTDASHEHPVCGGYHLLMEEEIWKHAAGFASWMEVSNMGRCRSTGHLSASGTYYPPKILNTYTKNGYKNVSMALGFKGGKNKIVSVHRLVAFAFVPNPENKPHVNHINFRKDDNRSENLEWNTMLENARHGLKFYNFNGYNSPRASLTKDDAMRVFLATGTYKQIAANFGVCMNVVSKIKRKKSYINIHV